MPTLREVSNRGEKLTFQELQKIVQEYGYHVNEKMCVQDALRLRDWKTEPLLSSFAKNSHFDFLVCNQDHLPLFAVEFDGPRHEADTAQIERDKKKNKLCELFSLPLLRINTEHLIAKYNQASLLQWIISAWELQKAFDDAQMKGGVPYDEVFDPILQWHLDGKTTEEIHPHWLSLKPRNRIRALHAKGVIPHEFPCGVSFVRKDEAYVGIEWIDVGKDQVVYVTTGMKSQQFPLYLGDLFQEILSVQLDEKLQEFLNSGAGAVAPAEVEGWLASRKAKHQYASLHSGPTCVNFSFP